jgi:predicted DNA-binding transcriptional regulator AlpA
MPKPKSATSHARHQSVARPTSTEAELELIMASDPGYAAFDLAAGFAQLLVDESRKEVDAKLTELDYRVFQLEHGQHESSEFDRDCFVDHEPVAEFLGTSVQGLRRLMVDGLPYHRLSPRVTRFRKSEIIKWVQSRP